MRARQIRNILTGPGDGDQKDGRHGGHAGCPRDARRDPRRGLEDRHGGQVADALDILAEDERSPDELAARLEEAGLGEVDITVYGWPLGYALEAVRNRIDARKLEKVGDLTPEELTRATGRTLQPSGQLKGAAIALATSPFMALQRLRPDTGTGLVARRDQARLTRWQERPKDNLSDLPRALPAPVPDYS